jgi:cytochrome P450
VQERLADEVRGIDLAPENATDRLPEFAFARAVIDEVLRLYPAAFVIVREALGGDVAAGVRIAAGSLVLIAPWVLHRHRRFWTAPERFDPSRFVPGAPQPPRFAYMPFGAGPRTCVGAPFALTELVLVIATLVRNFRIELAPHAPVKPVGLVTIQPDLPPPFLLRRRGVAG